MRKLPPYLTLDAWRGFAALAVVAYHVTELSLKDNQALHQNPFYALNSLGFTGVQIFFVISGYCIAHAAANTLGRSTGQKTLQPLTAFLKARGRRIYPTYWGSLVVTVGFFIAASQMAAHGLMANNIFASMNVFAQPPLFYWGNLTLSAPYIGSPLLLPVAWTLCYELSFYAIVALVLMAVLVSRRQADALLSVLHTLTVACFVGLIVAPQRVPVPLDLWAQFGMGVMLFDLLVYRPRTTVPRLFGGAILGLCLVLIALHSGNIGMAGQPLRLSFGAALGCALLLFVLHRWDAVLASQKAVRIAAWLGAFSYSLYLTHFFVIRVVHQVALRVFHGGEKWHYLVFLFSVGGAVVAAFLFYLVAERPLLRRPASLREKPERVGRPVILSAPASSIAGEELADVKEASV